MANVLPLELQADIQQHSIQAMNQEQQQARIRHYNVLIREHQRRKQILEALSADPQRQVQLQRTGTQPNGIGRPSRVLVMHGAPNGPEEQWTQDALRASVTTIRRTIEAQATVIAKYNFRPIVEDTVPDETNQPHEASGDEDLPDADDGHPMPTDEADSEAGVETAVRALERLQANPGVEVLLSDTELRRLYS